MSEDEDKEKQRQRGLYPFNQVQYDTIKALVLGTFHVKCKERTRAQKNAVIQYWRKKCHFSVEEDKLLFDGKSVMLKAELSKTVNKEFHKAQGCGARSMAMKLKRRYEGVTEMRVLRIYGKSKVYQQTFARFTNKSAPVPVVASDVNERWQIDLIDFSHESVQYDSSTYKYALSVVDVFSRFLFLRPLKSKSSKNVAKELEMLFAEHGTPRIIQSDQGTEFRGQVEKLLAENNVKAIKSSPYHPQSQGKCERSHRLVRQKIKYNLRQRSGFNWAKDLHKIQMAINNTPKEVIAYRTPAEVYHARGLDNQKLKEVRMASERCSNRTTSKGYKTSTYKVGERVLIRYPLRGSRVPKRRYIISGHVQKRVLETGKYKVKYTDPYGNKRESWASVQDITSETQAKERHRRKISVPFRYRDVQRRKHRKRYKIPLTRSEQLERFDVFQDGSVTVLLDPQSFGDCQFEAVADQMVRVGIHRSHTALRNEAVTHIQRHLADYSGFIEGSPERYVKEMRRGGVYGDHVTLQALSREYNVQFVVLSSRGIGHTSLVSNSGQFDKSVPTLTLGHLPEGEGEHYLSLNVNHASMQQLIEVLSRNSDPLELTEHQDVASGEAASDKSLLVCTAHMEGGLPQPGTTHAEDSLEAVRPYIEDSPQSVVAHSDEERGTTEAAATRLASQFLPLEIQSIIVKKCLESDPSSRFILMNVNRFFREVVEESPLPEIYINPGVLADIPNPISVRRLVLAAGRGSGLTAELRQIIRNPRWFSSWLRLSPKPFHWYQITDIFWRRQ